jgi:hypothetical protein
MTFILFPNCGNQIIITTGLYKIKEQLLNSILVTGALGNVGGEILRQILDQGIAVRAVDIDQRALKSGLEKP